MQPIVRFSMSALALVLSACGAVSDVKQEDSQSLHAEDVDPDTSVSNNEPAPDIAPEEQPSEQPGDPGEPDIAPDEDQACPEIYGPVCSESGETFANECFATVAGAVIACDGECPCEHATDEVPGDPVEPSDQGCPEIYGPVCGADGATYPNDCFADAAGVQIACNGECPCAAENPEECPAEWRGDGWCDLCLGDDPDCAECPAEWWNDGQYCDTCFWPQDPDCG